MAKKRATINISLEAKSKLDNVRTPGQSYDGIIRELVKFWREKNSLAQRQEQRRVRRDR